MNQHNVFEMLTFENRSFIQMIDVRIGAKCTSLKWSIWPIVWTTTILTTLYLIDLIYLIP